MSDILTSAEDKTGIPNALQSVAGLEEKVAARIIGPLHRKLSWISLYVKKHEILIIAALAAVLIFGVAGKVQDIIERHDQHVYNKKEAALQQQVDANAKQAAANALVAQANAQAAADYKRFADATIEQNNKLAQQNNALAAKLSQQQAADAKLPSNELAGRIITLANLRKDSVIPKPDNSLSVAQDASVGIAQALENLPVLTQQLANVQTEKDNDEKVIAKHDGIVAGLNQQIGGLNTLLAGKDAEIKKADAACAASVKVAVDKAKRGKGKWFVAGYIAGLLTQPLIKAFSL